MYDALSLISAPRISFRNKRRALKELLTMTIFFLFVPNGAVITRDEANVIRIGLKMAKYRLETEEIVFAEVIFGLCPSYRTNPASLTVDVRERRPRVDTKRVIYFFCSGQLDTPFKDALTILKTLIVQLPSSAHVVDHLPEQYYQDAEKFQTAPVTSLEDLLRSTCSAIVLPD